MLARVLFKSPFTRTFYDIQKFCLLRISKKSSYTAGALLGLFWLTGRGPRDIASTECLTRNVHKYPAAEVAGKFCIMAMSASLGHKPPQNSHMPTTRGLPWRQLLVEKAKKDGMGTLSLVASRPRVRRDTTTLRVREPIVAMPVVRSTASSHASEMVVMAAAGGWPGPRQSRSVDMYKSSSTASSLLI